MFPASVPLCDCEITEPPCRAIVSPEIDMFTGALGVWPVTYGTLVVNTLEDCSTTGPPAEEIASCTAEVLPGTPLPSVLVSELSVSIAPAGPELIVMTPPVPTVAFVRVTDEGDWIVTVPLVPGVEMPVDPVEMPTGVV